MLDVVRHRDTEQLVVETYTVWPDELGQPNGARQAGGPGSAIYGSSKAFAQGLTRYLARDHAKDNIRVNAVAPGFVLTPLQERSTSPEQQQQMAARIPMRRAGLPADLVGAYLFLASDSMSGWITGATIDVNGGAYFG